MAEFDESKHPRDEDGKFTDGSGTTYRQNASYGEILARDKRRAAYDSRDDFGRTVERVRDKTSRVEHIPEPSKFNRLNTKNHIRHAKELGYKNQAEYEKAAAEFFMSTRGKLYIDKHSGKFYRYEEKTRLLAVVDGDGGIGSFYRAEGKKYFERKKEQLKLYEIE